MTLKEIRKMKDICNARQVAKQLGITYRQYHRIESGEAKLNNGRALKLSQIFKIDVTQVKNAWKEGRQVYEKANRIG